VPKTQRLSAAGGNSLFRNVHFVGARTSVAGLRRTQRLDWSLTPVFILAFLRYEFRAPIPERGGSGNVSSTPLSKPSRQSLAKMGRARWPHRAEGRAHRGVRWNPIAGNLSFSRRFLRECRDGRAACPHAAARLLPDDDGAVGHRALPGLAPAPPAWGQRALPVTSSLPFLAIP